MCNHIIVAPNLNSYRCSVNLSYFLNEKPCDGSNGIPLITSVQDFFKYIGYSYNEYKDRPLTSIQYIEFTRKYSAKLNNKPYPLFIPYKCGRCPECIQEYTVSLENRSLLEAYTSKSLIFFDLTYAPETLPENESLSKQDISDFFKDFRSSVQRLPEDSYFHDLKIRYVVCGEYGSKYGRPHYHVLLFSNKWIPINKLEEFKQLSVYRWQCPYYYKKADKTKVYLPYYQCCNSNYVKYEDIKQLFGSRSKVPKHLIIIYKNNKYKGYISKFEFARKVDSSAKYICKYIAKNRLYHNSDFENTKRVAPFLLTPRSSALGKPALLCPEIIDSYIKSGQTFVQFTLKSQSKPKIIKIKVNPFITSVYHTPLCRDYPKISAITSILHTALNTLSNAYDVDTNYLPKEHQPLAPITKRCTLHNVNELNLTSITLNRFYLIGCKRYNDKTSSLIQQYTHECTVNANFAYWFICNYIDYLYTPNYKQFINLQLQRLPEPTEQKSLEYIENYLTVNHLKFINYVSNMSDA